MARPLRPAAILGAQERAGGVRRPLLVPLSQSCCEGAMKCVFVTVGTTSFDDLIATICSPVTLQVRPGPAGIRPGPSFRGLHKTLPAGACAVGAVPPFSLPHRHLRPSWACEGAGGAGGLGVPRLVVGELGRVARSAGGVGGGERRTMRSGEWQQAVCWGNRAQGSASPRPAARMRTPAPTVRGRCCRAAATRSWCCRSGGAS